MKVTCPQCDETQEARREELLGNYVRCRRCGFLFLWLKHLQRSGLLKTGLVVLPL